MENKEKEIKEQAEKDIEKRKSEILNFLFGWLKNIYDKLFLFILFLSFVLYLWVFFKTMNQAVWYDAATYLVTAKRWALGLDVYDVWYYRRGFFWALFCAFFFKIGMGETAIRFATVLFSTSLVAVSYFTIKKLFDEKIALLSSIGVACSWVILFFTGHTMTDIPASVFLFISLIFFLKGFYIDNNSRYAYLFGFFYALTLLTRMQFSMFAPVFFILLLVKHKFAFFKSKYFWLSLIIFALVISPYLYLYYEHYGNPLTDILNHYLGIEGISKTGQVGGVGNLGTIFAYFKDLPYILTVPILILFVLGAIMFLFEFFISIDYVFRSPEVQKKALVFLWIFILFLEIGYVAPNVEQRYIMATIPFLFYIAALPIMNLPGFFSKNLRIGKKFIAIILVLVFVIALIPNLRWANTLINNKKTSYIEVKEAGIWLKQNSQPGDIIIGAADPILEYYSDRKVIHFDDVKVPAKSSKEDVEQFIQKNKPKYFILSVFDYHPQWAYTYPQEHQDMLEPVQVYQQNNQPLLIIYKFKY